MKKLVKMMLFLLVIILLFNCIMKLIKKEHSVKYNLDNYEIEENFYTKGKKSWYDFIIKNKKNNFSYSLNEKLDKKKKVLEKIKTYKKNNLTCIIPIYKKTNIDNKMYCNLNNQSVSNNYLQETNNRDFQAILKKAKNYSIKVNAPSQKKKKYKKLEVYQDNLEDNYKYIIWYYKGIYVIEKEKLSYQKILDYDLYDNVMATIVGNFYVLFENSSVNGIENIHYYDLVKEKLYTYKLEKKLNKNSYINGVNGNLIFVTDNDAKKQYSINLKKKKIEEVGNDEKGYQKYQNGKLKFLSKSDFFIKKQFFDNEVFKDKILKSIDLRKEYNYFYYLDNNKMYKVLDNNRDHPILLFELSNIKEWKIIDRDIMMVADDSLYLYNDDGGLRKIVISNELKYNYKNICNLWKK